MAEKPKPTTGEPHENGKEGRKTVQRKSNLFLQKRIGAEMKEEDYLQYKYYYGDATLKLESAWYGKTHILVYPPNGGHLLWRLECQKDVFEKLPDKIKSLQECRCKVCFYVLADLEKSKRYSVASLADASYIAVRKC